MKYYTIKLYPNGSTDSDLHGDLKSAENFARDYVLAHPRVGVVITSTVELYEAEIDVVVTALD